jgi:uncharacterized protein (TIGR00255 family)
MTGFGIGEAALGAGKLALEIRGVNHRFVDVRVRMPRELGELSGFVEQFAREKFSRGRFEISVRVEGVLLNASVIDRARARTAYRALCELRDELAPGTDVPLAMLASVPDLFVSSVEREMDSVRESLQCAFLAALRSLDDMRAVEGAALKSDLVRRLDKVIKLNLRVAERSPDVVDAHKRRLRERAERLRTATELVVDQWRLEQEIVLFADRVDICEELTRLDSHCEQFARLTESQEAIGRRLDFLLQEMAREANTVGAKSPDAQISHAIVEVKAEIERMREQVQNVE